MTKEFCRECGKPQGDNNFVKDKSRISGHKNICKKCHSHNQTAKSRTKHGLVTRIHSAQRSRSRKRQHPMPNYTVKELRDWLFPKKLFHVLFAEWEESKYDRELAPSLDRKDDYLPYTFGNIQLTTWGKNKKRAYDDRRQGRSKNGECCIRVIQYTANGEFISEYVSYCEAERQTGVHNGNIALCVKRRIPSAGGFIWCQYKLSRGVEDCPQLNKYANVELYAPEVKEKFLEGVLF